jgi:hypothetical protein
MKFPSITVEIWLLRKLAKLDLLDGVTTAEERCERVRARILELGLADLPAGRRNGKDHVWRSLFAELYGCPLEPTTNHSEQEFSRANQQKTLPDRQ